MSKKQISKFSSALSLSFIGNLECQKNHILGLIDTFNSDMVIISDIIKKFTDSTEELGKQMAAAIEASGTVSPYMLEGSGGVVSGGGDECKTE